MVESPFTFTAPDGTAVFVHRWLPSGRPAAVMQIIHGLAEHAARYRRLAETLTASGYAVYANDLRGHGRTAKTPGDLGWFAESHGWGNAFGDIWQLNQIIAGENARLPQVLLGHSMGALLARQFMAEHGGALSGVVLSGASGQPTPLALAGRAIARAEKLRLGARGKSALLKRLTFDSFNKPFEPARTRFDWLSRDTSEVDKYAADAFCGFNPAVQLWIDVLDAWPRIARRPATVPRDLPIYLISGTHDSVSAGTRMVEPMLAQYRAGGLRVEHKFYPEARHELLNEVNRDEVTGDLLAWLTHAVRAGRSAIQN